MKLIIDNKVREKYPDLRIGVIVGRNIKNTEYSKGLEDHCNKVFNDFSSKYRLSENLEKHKNIKAWRDIYRSFGANPKKKTPTAEALLSRAIRAHYVPHISPAVDSYLIAETLHCLPIGGYDLDKVVVDITLRFSDGNEEFWGIGSDNVEHTDSGEVVYSDRSRILTRRWNYKDCDYSKIRKETETLALFVEGPLSVIEDHEIEETTRNIAENLARYCDAETKVLFFEKSMNDGELY